VGGRKDEGGKQGRQAGKGGDQEWGTGRKVVKQGKRKRGERKNTKMVMEQKE